MKLRKLAVPVILATALLTLPSTPTVEAASPVKATITRRIDGCDYFMVEMKTGYGVLEWYGGHDPDKDDVLYGDMRSYGMKNIYDETADEGIKVWVEDYDLSKSDAQEKLLDECE